MFKTLLPGELIENTKKQQIVLFHNPVPKEPYLSHYYIYKDGTVEKLLDDSKWCVQLDLEPETFDKNGVSFRYLDKTLIGITLENVGPVMYKNNTFHPVWWVDKQIDAAYEYCTKTKWRGYQHWELYYEKQLESLRELLLSLCERHSIPKTYNADIWDVSRRALMGTPGIFCRCSFIKDAHDLHPQIELVNMLKSL